MSMYTLDYSHHHTLLLGTSLSSCLLSSSLSRNSHRCLHVDSNSQYGDHHSTINLRQMREMVNNHKYTESATGVNSGNYIPSPPSSTRVDQWKKMIKVMANDDPNVINEGDNSIDLNEKYEFEFAIPMWEEIISGMEEIIPIMEIDDKLKKKNPSPSSSPPSNVNSDHAHAVPSPSTSGFSEAKTENKIQREEKSSPSLSSPPLSSPSSSSSSLSPSPSPSPAATYLPSLLRDGTNYAFDLRPHLLFSRSAIIPLIVTTNLTNNIDFQAINNSYIVSQSPSPSSSLLLTEYPLSRSSIFESSLLSLSEKRLLMKFLSLIAPTQYKISKETFNEQEEKLNQWGKKPFIEFLSSEGIVEGKENSNSSLYNFILYCLAAADHHQSSPSPLLSTAAAISRLRTFLASIGVYGKGAFLYPLHGISELPQAFSRFSAVWGSTFILNFKPDCLIFYREKKNETALGAKSGGEWRSCGMIGENCSFLTSCNRVICSPHVNLYFPNFIQSNSQNSPLSPHLLKSPAPSSFISHAILLLSSPLPSLKKDLSFAIIPPHSLHNNPHPIRIYQLDDRVKSCRYGEVVVYLYTIGGSKRRAKEDLEGVVKELCQWREEKQSDNEENIENKSSQNNNFNKPQLLYGVYYTENVPSSPSTPTPFSNVYCFPPSPPSLSIDEDVEEAKLAHDKMIIRGDKQGEGEGKGESKSSSSSSTSIRIPSLIPSDIDNNNSIATNQARENDKEEMQKIIQINQWWKKCREESSISASDKKNDNDDDYDNYHSSSNRPAPTLSQLFPPLSSSPLSFENSLRVAKVKSEEELHMEELSLLEDQGMSNGQSGGSEQKGSGSGDGNGGNVYQNDDDEDMARAIAASLADMNPNSNSSNSNSSESSSYSSSPPVSKESSFSAPSSTSPSVPPNPLTNPTTAASAPPIIPRDSNVPINVNASDLANVQAMIDSLGDLDGLTF